MSRSQRRRIAAHRLQAEKAAEVVEALRPVSYRETTFHHHFEEALKAMPGIIEESVKTTVQVIGEAARIVASYRLQAPVETLTFELKVDEGVDLKDIV